MTNIKFFVKIFEFYLVPQSLLVKPFSLRYTKFYFTALGDQIICFSEEEDRNKEIETEK
jgi:hypothetical protein